MLFEKPLAIVDLETTGGHVTRDRITEVGVILIDGDRVERIETLVNPQQPIPAFIEQMTGIRNEMVAGAPRFETLAEGLLEKLQGRLFVAHNARFDYGFLKNEFKRAGLRFQAEVLCTVKLSRRLYPQHYKHNLDSLIARHGLVLADRHRAMADAEAVWQFLQSAAGELGETTVIEAARHLLARPSVPPGLDQEVVDSLPDVPGVYFFYGENDLPLYVGKSVNLRSRVMSHFSGDHAHNKEMRIAQQVRRIDWRETLGEFGAILLEAQLIKSMQPIHNVRGRMSKDLCSICLDTDEGGLMRPRIVYARDVDFGRTADLYGLFRSQREAKKALTDMAQAHELCQATLGIEGSSVRKGTPCFGFQVRKCKGVCAGREAPMQHNMRLMTALARLRVKSWPFPGPVAVVETDEVSGATVEHVFDRWCYLGSRGHDSEAFDTDPSFDLETYRLLAAYLKKPMAGTSLRLLEADEPLFAPASA